MKILKYILTVAGCVFAFAVLASPLIVPLILSPPDVRKYILTAIGGIIAYAVMVVPCVFYLIYVFTTGSGIGPGPKDRDI